MDLSNFRRRSEVDETAWAEWLEPETETKNVPDSHIRPSLALPKKSQSSSLDGMGFRPNRPGITKKNVENASAMNETTPAVSIQIHLPSLKRPQLPAVPWKKIRLGLLMVGVVAALLVGGKWINAQTTRQTKPSEKAPVIVSAELGYRPLQPPVDVVAESSEVPKPSYDEKRKLYTFNDIHGNAHITVNQQAVPEKLVSNEAEIKKLATSIGTTETFTTTLGTVHIVTSKESGSQRLFLVNNKMLMFIQSTAPLSTVEWVEYIQALK